MLLGGRRDERHRRRSDARRQTRARPPPCPCPSSRTRPAPAASACRSARHCRTRRRTPRPARRPPGGTGRPVVLAALTLALGVGLERGQHRDRVDARRAQPLPVAEVRDHPARSPRCPGRADPTRVSVARLRISAVIGMSVSSSASHTTACAEALRRDRLARQTVLANEPHDLVNRLGALRPARRPRSVAAPDPGAARRRPSPSP